MSHPASCFAPAALLMGLLPLAASAELLSATHYADELERCVVEIRTQLEARRGPALGDLRHEVYGVTRERLWYDFEIRTVAEATPVSTTACRAYRYQARTHLVAEPLAGAPAQLAQTD